MAVSISELHKICCMECQSTAEGRDRYINRQRCYIVESETELKTLIKGIMSRHTHTTHFINHTHDNWAKQNPLM